MKGDVATSPQWLLLEDNPLDALACLDVFKSTEISCIHLKNLHNTFKWLNDGGQPKAALLDLQLPDGNCLDLVSYLHHRFPSLPIYIASAFAEVPMVVQAIQLGALDFLEKPLKRDKLLSLIENSQPLQTNSPMKSNRSNSMGPFDSQVESQNHSDVLLKTSYFNPFFIKNSIKIKSHFERSATKEIPAETCKIDFAGGTLIYTSESPLKETLDLSKLVANKECPLYIKGESGTGKEILARYIHHLSKGNNKAFIPVNCGAIPAHLMESLFFGHLKGAFTGAHQDQTGYFCAAEGGTLFLDEIAELPLGLQSKLLRVLQEGEVTPLGSIRPKPVHFRLMSASHKDLKQLVEQGAFREDLYYRIHVFPLALPSLRQRPMDLPALINGFLPDISSLEPQDLNLIQTYPWPGNIRELKNVCERYSILRSMGLGWEQALEQPSLMNSNQTESSSIHHTRTVKNSPDFLTSPSTSNSSTHKTLFPPALPINTSDFEASSQSDPAGQNEELIFKKAGSLKLILQALKENGFNREGAAKSLGISKRTLQYRLASFRQK